jgi:wyosine [tRNA(Phe)-imidazoG37] synthetase (radical SAM superfamily)
MDRKDVQEELMPADILLPSLDSALEESFQLLNRPHPECNLKNIIEGLRTVLGKFKGKTYLEILFLEGINTDRKNLLALASVIKTLKLDSIQLNTAVRPGTEKSALPLDINRLKEIRQFFGPKAEIIAAPKVQAEKTETDAEKKILSLIKRRPCTVEDINRSLGIPVPGVVKIIYSLLEGGKIVKEEQGTDIFYTTAIRDDN